MQIKSLLQDHFPLTMLEATILAMRFAKLWLIGRSRYDDRAYLVIASTIYRNVAPDDSEILE
jgi:hypothetical protein